MAQVVQRKVRLYDTKLRDFVTVDVAISVDWQEIANQLAPKAYKNKSRQSGLAAGAIHVEIVGDGQ